MQSRAATPSCSEEVARWLRFIDWKGEPLELQALDVPKGSGGYTENLFAHAETAAEIESLVVEIERRKAKAAYYVFNTIDPIVATRGEPWRWNVALKGSSLSDDEMESRRALFVDIDQKRPKNTSTTDAELADALRVAGDVTAHLETLGVPASACGRGMSGNGSSVMIALDNITESPELKSTISGILAALHLKHGTADIKIDPAVIEAKRLCPLWGTTKRKGAAGRTDRPHRRSTFTCADVVTRLGMEDLTRLLSALRDELAPDQILAVDKSMGKRVSPSSTAKVANQSSDDPFLLGKQCDVRQVAARLGLMNGDDPICPGCRLTGDSSVAFVSNGLKCSHARCADKGFRDGFRTTIDMVTEVNGCSPIEAVRQLGEWFGFDVASKQPVARKTAVKPAVEISATAPTPGDHADVVNINSVRRPLRSRSYLTAVSIIEENMHDVLGGRSLELNEMTGCIEIGRSPLKDSDESTIRSLIELRFTGGIDKNGNEIGLQLATSDITSAIAQVANARAYHPVRDYLNGLVWDGVERLDFVAVDILNAEDSALNRILMRRFFISAVARPLDPGCKVDTMLVLVGKQGAMKSTFFKVLSVPWFIDTPVDINADSARAFQTMRRAWLYEWAELETLLKARDTSTAKAFISSPEDTYIPKYGRYPVNVKRSGVIVGTINPDEFLTDETGARRFWPIKAGEIRLDVAREQRDQLWAEAVHRYRAGEPWWLTLDEDNELGGVHEQHRVRDAWEEKILSWAECTPFFTTGDVLGKALGKEAGQWSRADEMRVAKVLTGAGYHRMTDPSDRKRKSWRLR